jgi:hypothetical protein
MSGQFTGDDIMLRTALALAALGAYSTSALAQSEPSSAYVQIDACPSYQLEGEPVWESACPGYENWSVFFRASEHGSGISYAFNGSERTDFYRPPAQLLFGNFHNTIEWRMDAEGVYATIHRYISEGPNMDADPNETEEPAGEPPMQRQDLLLITALTPDDYQTVACPLYVVDASTISDANNAARILADTFAPGHQCDDSEPYVFTAMDEIYATVEAFDMQQEEAGQATPPKSKP